MSNATDDQLIGLPNWTQELHFDLDAKVAAEDVAAFKAASDEEKDAMLQGILEDRFKLKAHKETRELPVYDLVVARGGPKLKVADPANTYENGVKFGGKVAGPGGMSTRMDGRVFRAEFQACGIDRILPLLTMLSERTVIDKTGLTGKYDLKLAVTPKWVKDDTDAAVPRLLTAVPEQLGLKLEPAKGPVTVLVVDHVEKPSAN
jgi:uncharacterized protein (TIGR03435 family)